MVGILKAFSCLVYLIILWAACYYAPWTSKADNDYLDGESISAPIWAGRYEKRHLHTEDRAVKQDILDSRMERDWKGLHESKGEKVPLTVHTAHIIGPPGSVIAAKSPSLQLNTPLLLMRIGLATLFFGTVTLLMNSIRATFNRSTTLAHSEEVSGK